LLPQSKRNAPQFFVNKSNANASAATAGTVNLALTGCFPGAIVICYCLSGTDPWSNDLVLFALVFYLPALRILFQPALPVSGCPVLDGESVVDCFSG